MEKQSCMWGRRSGRETIPTTRSGRSSALPMSASTRRAIRIIGASTICGAIATTSNRSAYRSTWYNCRCRRGRSRSRRARTSCWRRNRSGSVRLDSICSLIERLAAAGIPAAKYNLTIVGIPRTEREPGRGGSRNAAFRWSCADQTALPGKAGVVHGGRVLGADRPLPRRYRAGCDRGKSPPRLPSAGPLHAARLPRRDRRARHGRGAEAVS